MNDLGLARSWAARSLTHHQISSGARIPELDGARGVAVLAVVVSHYFGWVEHGFNVLRFGGDVGVNLFFALSGFLIGSIILERKDSPNFFSVFYTRRTLRILPVYFVTLAVTLAFIQMYGSAPLMGAPLPSLSYFTFTQNFVMVWRGEFGAIWLMPTWTLAVEEQFYLVVPLLIVFTPTRFVLPTIICGIVLCFLTRIILYEGHAVAAQVLLFSNGHFLMIGVLSAYIHQRVKVQEIILRLAPLASVAALLLVEAYTALFGDTLLLAAAPAFMSTLFSSYILLAARSWPKLGFLRSRTLRAFGTISYCLYLIHQPVNGVLHGLILGGRPDIATALQILVTCAAVIVSISLAAASWFALEQPLLRLGQRKTYKPLSPDALPFRSPR